VAGAQNTADLTLSAKNRTRLFSDSHNSSNHWVNRAYKSKVVSDLDAAREVYEAARKERTIA
jgi:hypothetical protein